ncbi:MAG: hypothetical protein KF780_13280 [Sphingomonas sp.]|nr:hypothetical protein [Sphingomonas sp.]
MANATRRQFLAGSTALPLAGLGFPSAGQASPSHSVAADLQRYIGFGGKQSGGAGDNACGEWLAEELARAGFAVERQSVAVPFFAPERCALVCGAAQAAVWPQPIVRPTPDGGIAAPLVRVDADGHAAVPLDGAIALVDLPFGRWSSATAPRLKRPIEAAFAAGAGAVVAIVNGPTGKVIALNADGREPMFAGPVALLAPEDAAPFRAAAGRGERGVLHLTGEAGRRPGFNLIGRIDRGAARWLIVSTPRSGWFTCAGERGGGIAAWLDLARWLPGAAPRFNLAFICNSGHEYEYLGAEEMLREIAPRPAETAFWLHLGANVAARDWHEAVGGMRPLPGTDSQRYLVTSPSLLPVARREFAGLAGLEAPYGSDVLSAGELTNVIAAGYPLVAGVFGIHRFHHVADDDERCVDAGEVARATAAFRRLVAHVVATV